MTAEVIRLHNAQRRLVVEHRYTRDVRVPIVEDDGDFDYGWQCIPVRPAPVTMMTTGSPGKSSTRPGIVRRDGVAFVGRTTRSHEVGEAADQSAPPAIMVIPDDDMGS
jgi:hypothetical protein